MNGLSIALPAHQFSMHMFVTLLIAFTIALSGCTPADVPMAHNHGGMMMQGADVGKYLPSDSINAKTVPNAKPSSILMVKNGDTIDLSPMVVKKMINGKEQVMFGYNGQIPGPLIKVKQGSTFYVNVMNKIPLPTTNHWHGLRLDNAFDGMPGISQSEIRTGDSFQYTVKVPDSGLYWYHPHVREDVEQDLGLYGNIFVTPKGDDNVPADREETLILDDILLDASGNILPYGKDGATYVMMGRYGNTMLLNGETDYTLNVRQGEVIRFYLTNTANARPFRISFSGAMMKLIGSDLGTYEMEQPAEWLTIGPAERYIVDVLFDKAGRQNLLHWGNGKPVSIGTVNVSPRAQKGTYAETFSNMRAYPNSLPEASALAPYMKQKPDEILRVSFEGMNHGTVTGDDGIEWEDSMPMMNAMTNQNNFSWKLVDDRTGKTNMDIHWMFKLGDRKKIRIINDDESMQHPIHFHGQRFLVLSVDEKPVENRVWKDTFLLRSGETADILLELTNPGTWMFHCHIAEHLQAGMMGIFSVE